MSEEPKTPFEKARENARIFAENADMMQSLSNLKQVIEESQGLSQLEQEGISMVVEATLKTLSKFLIERGDGWN